MRLCSIEGCGRKHDSRGFCSTHYGRWYRHGDPLVLVGRRKHVVQHGTYNEYNNYGCRCEVCRQAHAEFQRRYFEEGCPKCGAPIWGRFRTGALCRSCRGLERRLPMEELHGTETGYSGRGCRCDICRAGAAAARRRRRHANLEQRERENRKRRERYRREKVSA